ncbi:MAG: DNA mismatch repair protein MutS, partial [Vulcanimicrobiaceae bacterium]
MSSPRDNAPYPPLLEQYFGLRARHPDALLLMRVGDFYEAYGDDAETLAPLLGIALTSKEAGGRRVAMAGVPHHALDPHLAKLVAQRRIVALAEQLEAPVPNKLTHRDIVRVVTPGTLVEEGLLERGRENALVALSFVGDALGLVQADLSTGRAAATAFAGERALDEALAELGRIAPVEIVADVPFEVQRTLAASFPQARIGAPPLAAVEAGEREPFEGFSLDGSLAIRRALAGLLAFVRRTGLEAPEGLVRQPALYHARSFLALDANARRHLELVRAQGANPKATLLATIDRCRTAMGTRALARRLLAPLVERGEIERRLEMVAALVADYASRARIQEALAATFDLERIAQRVRLR